MPVVEHEREYVCCVDVSKAAVERTKKLLEGTDIELREVKHYKDYRNSDASWEEREKNVTDLLTVYQNAKCVITRRLHCALPCLAMGVPVLVLNNEKAGADIRFEPYYDWLYNCTREQYVSGEYGYDITNPPQNSKEYLPYREKLIKTVTDFADKYKDMHGTADGLSKVSYSEDELIRWRHDTMKDCMNRWLYVTRGHINGISKLKKNVKRLEAEKKSAYAENAELKKRLEQLENRLAAAEKKLEGSETELLETKEQNKRMKKIFSCRCVRYAVKLRNIFIKKKIKIEDYI
jgi:hypothetical protein